MMKDLGDVVIYTKEIKEKKERRVKKYLPSLIDDLPGNLCMFYLAWRRSTHRPYDRAQSPCALYHQVLASMK